MQSRTYFNLALNFWVQSCTRVLYKTVNVKYEKRKTYLRDVLNICVYFHDSVFHLVLTNKHLIILRQLSARYITATCQSRR